MRSSAEAGLGRLAAAAAFLFLAAAVAAPNSRAQGRPAGATKTIFIVRHGAYDEADPREENVGRGLTEAGRRQASLTGRRLAALPPEHRVDAVYASTMTRARETAELICAELPGLKPALDSSLCECGPPATDTTYSYHETPAEHERCRQTLDGVFARYFRPSAGRDSTVVLVCHGNVMRYLVCRALDVDPAATWWRMTVINCEVTEIQVRPDGKLRLLSFGDVGHLPPDLQTFNWKRNLYRK